MNSTHGANSHVRVAFTAGERATSTVTTEVKATRLLEDLAALGETEQEVHDRLLAIGVRGDPDDSMSCPVAEYLRIKGYRDVAVGGSGADADVAYSHLAVPIPKPIAEFTYAFDNWEHPDLVRDGLKKPCSWCEDPECVGCQGECTTGQVRP